VSEICDLCSGVIQPSGNNIGPLLFISFINKLADLLGPMFVTAKFFADDLKVQAVFLLLTLVVSSLLLIVLLHGAKIGSCNLQSINVAFSVLVPPLLALTFKLMVTYFP